MISPRVASSSSGKRSLIRGEGFVTRISSNIRPQDPGEGGSMVSRSPGASEDGRYEFTRSVRYGASVGSFTDFGGVGRGGQGWGAQRRVQSPHVDQDLRLLAADAKPASVTVCEDSHLSPSVEWDAVFSRSCREAISGCTC